MVFVSHRCNEKGELKKGDSSGVCDVHRKYTNTISMEISKRKKPYNGPTYRYSGDDNMGLKQTWGD